METANRLKRLVDNPNDLREFLKLSGIVGRINLNQLPRMELLCDGGELPQSLPALVLNCFLAKAFDANGNTRWLLITTDKQAGEVEAKGYLDRPAFLAHNGEPRGWPVKLLAVGHSKKDPVRLILVEQHNPYRFYYFV